MPLVAQLSIEHPKVKEFINLVTAQCKEKGVRFELQPTKRIQLRYGGAITECSGGFSEQTGAEPELLVGTDKPVETWFGILVHEYSHMVQYFEHDPTYTEQQKHDHIWKWIAGEITLTSAQIKKGIAAVRANELDCEFRSIQMIHDHNLPLDIIEYAQNANAYIWLYQFVQKHQFWPDVPPYQIKAILDAMPTTMKPHEQDYDNCDAMLALYERCYANELLVKERAVSETNSALTWLYQATSDLSNWLWPKVSSQTNTAKNPNLK